MAQDRNMSRMMRQLIHKKQERSQAIQEGEPRLADLVEGVPEFRSVTEKGVVQYVRYKDKIFSISMQSEEKVEDKYPKGSTLTSPGWDKSESGLILQWGYIDTGAQTGTTYFPNKFSSCFVVVAGSFMASASDKYNIHVTAQDNSKFSWYAGHVYAAGMDINWIALGI
jgi:hypothetical protein